MLSRAVAVSNTLSKTSTTHHKQDITNNNNNNNNEKDKELLQIDKDLYSSFWEGVYSVTILQNEKIKVRKTKPKFRKSLNDSLVEQIFVEHSKELIGQKYLFDNEAPLKIAWDCLVASLILYSVVIIPYRIGFRVITTRTENLFDSAVDLLFGFDLLVSFNTAYVDPITEIVITDRRKIALNYFKLWFWIDLISTIPFDDLLNLFVSSASDGLSALRLIKILRLTRMLKLFRVLKLSKIGKLIESFNINPAIIGVQKLLLQICFMAHLVACFWHYIARPQHKPNWLDKFGYIDDPRGAQYVASFYWTISTMLTIGYGDISGTNATERLFCIFTMLLGGVMFGAVIAQVTRLIESRNPQARAFKEKMDEIKAYLNEKVLPMKLKASVKEAYSFYLSKKSSFGETSIFEDLPPNLLNRLVLSIYSTEVHRVNLFKICDEGFIVKLVIASKPFQALPGMKIFEKGDVADEIVFIMRGLVQFTTVGYTETDGVVDAVTGYSSEGGYFGDFEYYKRSIRMVTHRAMCNCNLISIPTTVLDDAIESYPVTGDKILNEFNDRYNNFITASKSIAHKRDGFRVYLKDLLIVDGQLQNLSVDGDTSQIYSKRVNSSNAVLEVHRTVAFTKEEGKVVELHAEEHSDELIERYIILPKSDYKVRWDLFIGILILYSVIVIPVEIGFQVVPSKELSRFDTVVDIMFGIDMILSIRTSYYDDQRDAYVVTPSYIYKNYLKTWFFIDLFSVLPFELLLSGTASASIFRSLKLLKVVRLMRLLKLTRLAKLRQYFTRLEDSLGINPATFELIKLLLEVAFIGHLVCCLYWGLSWNISDYAWFDKLHLRHAPLKSRYIATLYWTFTTLSTVGYGDIVPVDTQSRVVTICIMVLGGTVFGYIVANVSSLMSSLDVTASRVNERVAEVSEYLIEKNASGPLAESIIKHIKYMFTLTSAFDERAILSRLPLHLSRKLILLQHSETLSKITLFQFIENKGVILYLFRLLTPIFYDSLQYVCTEGSLAHELVFLVSGKANVYKMKTYYKKLQNNTKHRPSHPHPHPNLHIRSTTPSSTTISIDQCDLVSQILPGDFFGHISMMLKRPYQASVRTFMPSSIYTLSQYEISKLLRNFPAVAITLQGSIALSISQSNSSNKQFLRLKRAEFLSGLGSAYVAAKAQAALKEKEIERSKSSKDVLSNLIRMNTTDSESGTGGISGSGGGQSSTKGLKRRSSLSMVFNRSKSIPVENNGSIEFSKISNEDETVGVSNSQKIGTPINKSNLINNGNNEGNNSNNESDNNNNNNNNNNNINNNNNNNINNNNNNNNNRNKNNYIIHDNSDLKINVNHSSSNEIDNDKILKEQINSDSKEDSSKTSSEGSPISELKPLIGRVESDDRESNSIKYLTELPSLQPKHILPPILSPTKLPKIKNSSIIPLNESPNDKPENNDSDSDSDNQSTGIHDSFNITPVKLKPLPKLHTINQLSIDTTATNDKTLPPTTLTSSPMIPSGSQRRPSKWNLVRAVVHDPAAMAIIQQTLDYAPKPDSNSIDGEVFDVYNPQSSSSILPPMKKKSGIFQTIANKSLELIGRNTNVNNDLTDFQQQQSSSSSSIQGKNNSSSQSRQIVRRSSSIAAVVRASIANRKRQRVMLLLSGNELYDSDEDKKKNDPFYPMKSKALFRKNRSCPDFHAVHYQISYHKMKFKKLKRRSSFPSLEYEMSQQVSAHQSYL